MISTHLQINKSLRIRERLCKLNLTQQVALTVDGRVARCNDGAILIQGSRQLRAGKKGERAHIESLQLSGWGGGDLRKQIAPGSTSDIIMYPYTHRRMHALGVQTPSVKETCHSLYPRPVHRQLHVGVTRMWLVIVLGTSKNKSSPPLGNPSGTVLITMFCVFVGRRVQIRCVGCMAEKRNPAIVSLGDAWGGLV